MKTWKDIVRGALAACLLWATGCGRLIYDEYPDGADPDPSSRAYLVLNIASAAPTRVADDKERMHSLRVVLLDKDGKVEYNDYITSSGRPDLFGAAGVGRLDYAANYRLIPTTPGEKKIFLIANEESVENAKGVSVTAIGSLTTYLDGFSKGDGGFEAAVNNLYFTPTPTYAGNIPLSSCYEFTVDASAVGTRVPKTFYLVHAATKFQFEFINKRLSPVRIDALSVSSIADDMYLMGHVDKNGSDYKKTPWGESESIYWVDWLAKVSEETTLSPNDKEGNAETNRNWGWITDYTIPATTHRMADIITSPAGGWTESNKNNWITIPQGGGTYTHPTIYYPESKNSTPGNDQEYSFSVLLTDTDAEMTGSFKLNLTFPASPEDQKLVALFRNTFVKVTCTVGYDDTKEVTLTLRIGICPWNEETIDIPAFD